MGLHIDIVTAKKLLCSFNGKIFYHIHTLTAAVITLARIAFCILVRKGAAHCRHNSLAHPVFRGDQFNMTVLSVLLVYNRLCDFRINASYFIK